MIRQNIRDINKPSIWLSENTARNNSYSSLYNYGTYSKPSSKYKIIAPELAEPIPNILLNVGVQPHKYICK